MKHAIIALLVLVCAPAALAQDREARAGVREADTAARVAAADLHRAARTGDVALLQARMRQGASPDTRDKEGHTPLMDAVAAGQLSSMRLLIAHKADVNIRANDGQTPLIEAAAEGRLDAAKLLVESGADLNIVSRGWGSALKTAERTGNSDVAAMLLQAGARSTGSSVGDTVCVRPWEGNGYCGTVVSIDKTHYRLRVTSIVGCEKGCAAKAECSAGRPVGGSEGIAVGDEVDTVTWCLTHTGVKP
jgi:hypothetical protein